MCIMLPWLMKTELVNLQIPKEFVNNMRYDDMSINCYQCLSAITRKRCGRVLSFQVLMQKVLVWIRWCQEGHPMTNYPCPTLETPYVPWSNFTTPAEEKWIGQSVVRLSTGYAVWYKFWYFTYLNLISHPGVRVQGIYKDQKFGNAANSQRMFV